MSKSRNASPELALEGFDVERATLEVRYPPAFALWDRAGQLWGAAQEQWPTLRIVHAQPSKTEFRVGENVAVVVELEKCNLVVHRPTRKMAEFQKLADEFWKIVSTHLDIMTTARIGTRLTFVKTYPTREAASGAVMDRGMISPAVLKGVKEGEQALLPHIAFRVEGKAVGRTYTLKAEDRMFELQSPFGFDAIQSTKETSHVVVYDIDYYSMAQVTAGQFGPSEWIDAAIRTARRDGESILGARP